MGVGNWSSVGAAFPIWYATTTDRTVNVLYCASSYSLHGSGIPWTGMTAFQETTLRNASVNQFPTSPIPATGTSAQARFNYMTRVAGTWTIPATVFASPQDGGGAALRANVPSAAYPCNDSDGHMITYQPNGRVLETYATHILSDGTICCGLANETDPSGFIDGNSGGTTASLCPNYAGQIKQYDIDLGVIDHAIAISIGVAQLSTSTPLLPAMAMDRNPSGFAGALAFGAQLSLISGFDVSGHAWKCVEGKQIAAAVNKYGMFIVDQGGPGVSIRSDGRITNANYVNNPGHPNYFLYDDLQVIVSNLAVVTP